MLQLNKSESSIPENKSLITSRFVQLMLKGIKMMMGNALMPSNA